MSLNFYRSSEGRHNVVFRKYNQMLVNILFWTARITYLFPADDETFPVITDYLSTTYCKEGFCLSFYDPAICFSVSLLHEVKLQEYRILHFSSKGQGI